MSRFDAPCPSLVTALTKREQQIKCLLVQGHANKVIALELGISQRTVEAHRARIFRKLQVRNAVELVTWFGRGARPYALAEPQSQS